MGGKGEVCPVEIATDSIVLLFGNFSVVRVFEKFVLSYGTVCPVSLLLVYEYRTVAALMLLHEFSACYWC